MTTAIPNINYTNAQWLMGRSRITDLISTKEFRRVIDFFSNPPSNNLEDLATLLKNEEKVISFSGSVSAEPGVEIEGYIKSLEIKIKIAHTKEVFENMWRFRGEEVWAIVKEAISNDTFFVHGILDYHHHEESQTILILDCDMFIAKNESRQGKLSSFLG